MRARGALLLLAGAAAAAASMAACSPSPSSKASSPPFWAPLGLKVVHQGPDAYIVNFAGARVQLRGVASNALIQYGPWHQEAPPISRADVEEMAAFGFDFLRLGLSWSRIMPSPGQLNASYLSRIGQVVSWARSADVAVLLDMHQDNYSLYTGPGLESDGAPEWAALTDGVSCTARFLTTTACAMRAWENFFADEKVAGKGVQEWYVEAMLAVLGAAKARGPLTNVAGIELMNEPWYGFSAPADLQHGYRFFAKAIDAIRAAGYQVPVWFEPPIYRVLTNDFTTAAERFSTDGDLVYAPHIYTGVFSPPFSPNASAQLSASYDAAVKEARTFHAALVVDEWGCNASPDWDGWISEQLALQNSHQVGSAFWLFKQRKGPWADWSLVRLDGGLLPVSAGRRDELLASVRLAAYVAARVVSVDGPDDRGRLVLRVVAGKGASLAFSAGLRSPRVQGIFLREDGTTATTHCLHAGQGAVKGSAAVGVVCSVALQPGYHVLVAH
jgi:endoglycosylceramidase